MSHTIRVVAAVVDKVKLTLYKPDGSTVEIPQGDPRLAVILATITPVLAEGPGSVAEVSLTGPQSQYANYQQKTNGLVRFFRVAKAALQAVYNAATVAPTVVGVLPSQTEDEGSETRWDVPAGPFLNATQIRAEEEARKRLMDQLNGNGPLIKPEDLVNARANVFNDAIADVIRNATPVDHPEFSDEGTGQHGDHTIVAAVGGQVIPGVEALRPQINHSANTGAKGLGVFLERLSKVIAERRHSVEDLMKFMEKGDLPIADDGSIVIYKILRRQRDHYVDCHSGNVTQKVGSYVCMAPELVDHDRRNECSNGLHVARRAYLGSFSGDVVVLAKVAPEDVIAVPEYDANKMRVCGYHILFELPEDAFEKLRQNRPFTDNSEAKLLLGRAIAGDHDAPIERVEITGQRGGGLKIKSLVTNAVRETVEVVEVEAIDADSEAEAPAVDVKTVVAQVQAAKAEVLTRAGKAKALYDAYVEADSDSEDEFNAAVALMDFKRKAKVSWSKLELPDDIGETLEAVIVEYETRD